MLASTRWARRAARSATWMRSRNRFSEASFQVSRICSSLMSRSSAGFGHGSSLVVASPRSPVDSPTVYRFYIDRRFKNRTRTGILWASRAKHIRAASSDMPLTSYRTVPGLTTAAQNSGSPFALAHAGFQGNRGDRLVREDADVQPAFVAQVLRRGDAAGLDRLRAEPAALGRLQSRSRRTTTRLPRVALPFIRPLWLFRCLTLLGISAIGSRPRYMPWLIHT